MELVFDNVALRDARKKKGLTQMEVSTASGVPQTTISSYECGSTVPTIKAMTSLASVYGVSAHDLIDLCFHEEVA